MKASGIGQPVWKQLTPPTPLPLSRDSAGLAYDQAGNQLIIFGGERTQPLGGTFNDVWLLTNPIDSTGNPASVAFSNPAFGVPDIAGTISPATTNACFNTPGTYRSEEHTSELQSRGLISY